MVLPFGDVDSLGHMWLDSFSINKSILRSLFKNISTLPTYFMDQRLHRMSQLRYFFFTGLQILIHGLELFVGSFRSQLLSSWILSIDSLKLLLTHVHLFFFLKWLFFIVRRLNNFLFFSKRGLLSYFWLSWWKIVVQWNCCIRNDSFLCLY